MTLMSSLSVSVRLELVDPPGADGFVAEGVWGEVGVPEWNVKFLFTFLLIFNYLIKILQMFGRTLYFN